ncbi:MAG: pantoate--beta-alanine ligase [Gammaproteobacteria bacterium]|nr:pantoate--beta-alanine ligase [Gammaproteobacteria bacterium]
MQTVNSIAALREQIAAWKREGLTVGFAPTMGNLHAGHISLITEALKSCDKAVSSVFVNPLQFGPNEDLEAYPRTLADDQKKLEVAGCDLLFAPPVQEMYPNGQAAVTTVSVPNLTKHHCGVSRPGHFDGVTTVVTKLLALVQPDRAYFGKKDFQQLRVIKQMVADLCLPVEVLGVETSRETDGLAMSSRNQYLTTEQRAVASTLRKTLINAAEALQQGETVEAVFEQSQQALTAVGFKPDYFNISDADTLEPQQGCYQAGQNWVILASAFLGKARLLDNIELIATKTQQ